MTIEKTLATCDLPDFLRQTIKMKDTVSVWLEKTKFTDKLKQRVELTGNETDEERAAKVHEQFQKNLSDALFSAMGEYAELTSEVMALCCFVEPTDIKEYRAIDFIQSFTDCIADKQVRDFFMSFARLGVTGTSAN